MNRIHFLFYFFLILFSGFSQQDNIWYFGNTAGLDFNTTPPTPLTNGQTSIVDNTSTISDGNGNLLFYTDGMKVWDKNHNIMPNGNGLTGSFTAGQVCLIVPIPCNSTKYVIFHHTEYSNPGNMFYTVVDMTLNAGLGDVVATQKNVSLGTNWTEKLCAYYYPAGNFYWVLSHKWGNDQFVAMKVDATTIATTSVVTSIGSLHTCGTFGGTHDAMGQLTISPDGSKVVNAMTCVDKFELFDFNITTGVLSNSISVPGNGGSAWGTAFSPDSKKFYTNSIFGTSVFQYDISVYTLAAINASKTTLHTMGATGYNFGYMELGPDNKVYITRPNTNWLSVVNDPNIAGAGCGFTLTGQSTGSKQSLWGTSRIAYNIPLASSGNLTLNQTVKNVLCNGQANGSATISPINSGSYTYTWQPGNFSTSSVNNLSPGTYTVTVSDGGCNTNSTTVTITEPSPLNLTVSPSSTACPGQNVVISGNASGGNGGYNYLWQPFATAGNSATVTSAVAPVYTLTVSDASLCVTSRTVGVVPAFVTSNFSISLNPCTGAVTTTNSSTFSNLYAWDFGDGTTSAAVSPVHNYSNSGTFTISLISNSSLGCGDTSYQTVTISNSSQSLFSYTNTVCDSILTLTNNSTGANSYLWNYGDGNTSSSANPANHIYASSGNYTVTLITNPGSPCADTSRQSIIISKTSISSFVLNNSPCTSTISAINTSSYSVNSLWLFGDGSSDNNINSNHNYSSTGIYTVTLITNPGTSCSDTSSQTVAINGLPVAAFNHTVDLCTGSVTFSNTSINALSGFWNFGDGHSSSSSPVTNYYLNNGTYSVSLVVMPGTVCADTLTKLININTNPIVADFTFTNQEFSYEAEFSNLSVNAVKYQWDFGDGTNSQLTNPKHIFNQMGEYVICLEATNASGCKNLLCKPIWIDAGWTIYIPNSFTPNASGINDIFFAYGTNIKQFKMDIFDRWGEKIFHSEDISKGWDGTYKGKPVQEGVYIWKAEVIDSDSKRHDKVGHVNVIR